MFLAMVTMCSIAALYTIDHDENKFKLYKDFVDVEHDTIFVKDSEEVDMPQDGSLSTYMGLHYLYRMNPTNKVNKIETVSERDEVVDKFKDTLPDNNTFLGAYLRSVLYRDIESMTSEEAKDGYEILYKSLLAEAGYNYKLVTTYRVQTFIFKHMGKIVLVMVGLLIVLFSFGVVFLLNNYYNIIKKANSIH